MDAVSPLGLAELNIKNFKYLSVWKKNNKNGEVFSCDVFVILSTGERGLPDLRARLSQCHTGDKAACIASFPT